MLLNLCRANGKEFKKVAMNVIYLLTFARPFSVAEEEDDDKVSACKSLKSSSSA